VAGLREAERSGVRVRDLGGREGALE